MPINNFLMMEEDPNTTVAGGVSLLKSAIALSPVAAGIWYGQRKLAANEALNTSISRASPIQALGKAQGALARRTVEKQNARAAKVAEKLRAGLSNSNELKEIFNKVEEHKALLHTLSITLEDPANGLEASAVGSLKNQIDKLLSEGTPESVEEFAERTVKSLLESSSPETLQKWQSNLNEFRKISGQLETPDFTIPQGGVAYNAIDFASFGSEKKMPAWQRRAMKLKEIFDKNPNYQLEVFQFEDGGKVFQQAQVSRRGRHVVSIPLHSGHNFFKSGQDFNTTYTMPNAALNMEGAYKFARSKNLPPNLLNMEELRKSGYLQSYPDYLISWLRKNTKNGHIDIDAFKTEMGLAIEGVERQAMSTGYMGRHMRRQATQSARAVYGHSFGRIDPKERMEFVSRIAMSRELEGGATGAKRLIKGIGANARAVIGIRQGSGFSVLQKRYGAFAVDRSQLPVTYRESQMLGRSSISIDPVEQIGSSKIGGVANYASMDDAELIKRYSQGGKVTDLDILRGRAIADFTQGIGSHVSGGLNKLVVMDFKSKGMLSRTFANSGQAVTGVSHRIVSPVQFSVLDPQHHKHAASSTLKKAVTGKVKLTRADLKNRVYMGQTGSGTSKYLTLTPDVESLNIELDRTGESYGKRMLYFRGEKVRNMRYLKLFSFGFKGNVQDVGEKGIDALYEKDVRLRDLEESLGKSGISGVRYKAMYASSDMASKGSFFFVHQIASIAKMFGIKTEELRDVAEDLFNNKKGRLGTTGSEVYAEAATLLMKKKGVSPEVIGMTLAGMWHGPEGKTNKETRVKIANMIKTEFDKPAQSAILRSMERGLVVYNETAAIGPSAGDWGKSQAGVERRFAQTVFDRLRQLGVQDTRAANVVARMYSKKIDFGKHYKLAEQMMALGRSAMGQRNILDAATEKNARVISWKDLQEELIDEENLEKILRKEKNGAIIDFSDADSKIKEAVKEAIGSDSIYLPGKAAFEASSGTTMKVAGGQSLEVSSAYGQLVKGLGGKLQEHSVIGGEDLAKSLKSWRSSAIELFTGAMNALSRGKLKGTSSPHSSQYNLDTSADLTKSQSRAIKRVFKGTSGTSIFGDTNWFLSEIFNRKASGEQVTDLAEEARMFFTGMESYDGKTVKSMVGSGLTYLSGRHPYISSGNLFLTQIFRDVREVASLGGEDRFFQSKEMQDMLGFLEKDFRFLKSFEEVSKLSIEKQREFFKHFVSKISAFTSGEGGGIMNVPRVSVGGLDVGVATQAYLDMDGDTIQTISIGKQDRKFIREALVSHNKNEVLLGQEFRSRVFKARLGDSIKTGLNEYGKELGIVKGSEKAVHDMMKEININQATGPLDVKLRPYHEGLLAYEPDLVKRRAYSDVLGALEENVLLKAKKIPVFVDIAGELQTVLDNMLTAPSEQSRDALNSLLKEKIFKNQDDVVVRQLKVGSDEDKAIGKMVERATAQGELRFNIDDFTNTLFEVARRTEAAGGYLPGTVTGMQYAFESDPDRAFMLMLDDANMEAAALRGFSGNSPQNTAASLSVAIDNVANNFTKLDRRLTPALAAGAGASMLLMGILGGPDYSSEPLVAPGEYVSPTVQNAISEGSLFQNKDPEIDPDTFGLRPAPNYDMLNTPIVQNNNYINKPNSYQIRGTINNGVGSRNTMHYLDSIAGGFSGSFRINDTRRPITSSYVDRLMGEY